MENRCSTPDEQPVSQYCEAFKTLGVQSADKLHFNSDCQTICSKDAASLALLVILTSPQQPLVRSSHSRSSPGSPAQDFCASHLIFPAHTSVIAPVPSHEPFDARSQRPAYRLVLSGHVPLERRQGFERVGTLGGHCYETE